MGFFYWGDSHRHFADSRVSRTLLSALGSIMAEALLFEQRRNACYSLTSFLPDIASVRTCSKNRVLIWRLTHVYVHAGVLNCCVDADLSSRTPAEPFFHVLHAPGVCLHSVEQARRRGICVNLRESDSRGSAVLTHGQLSADKVSSCTASGASIISVCCCNSSPHPDFC